MHRGLDLWVRDGVAGFAAPPPLPLADLVIGRPVAQAVTLLPRLFSLCAHAQATALRLALGLPVADSAGLVREILRDHVALLCLRWPQALDLARVPLVPGWTGDAGAARRMLLGEADLPEAPAQLRGWLASGQGGAPVLAAIAGAFAPGEATTDLPLVSDATAPGADPLENSPAARQADHPAVRAVERVQGRGPLWQAMGRLVDALACLEGRLPAARLVAPGLAVAPASRGVCAVRAHAVDGRLTQFARRTPTDHLLAPGGGLAQALAGLRPASPPRAGLVAALMDPCMAVTSREVAHA